jgi:hypothetical protein
MVSKKIYLLFLMNIFLNGTIEPFLKMHKLFIFHSLRLLSQEMQNYLGEEHVHQFEPYLTTLNEMFGDDVLPEAR